MQSPQPTSSLSGSLGVLCPQKIKSNWKVIEAKLNRAVKWLNYFLVSSSVTGPHSRLPMTRTSNSVTRPCLSLANKQTRLSPSLAYCVIQKIQLENSLIPVTIVDWYMTESEINAPHKDLNEQSSFFLILITAVFFGRAKKWTHATG